MSAVVVVVLCYACAVGGQTTISFWHGYSELETVVLEEQLIPLFEAANPGIRVEAVRLGYDELRDKIVATAAIGSGPDVIRMDIIWSPSFAAAGLLEPLDHYAGFQVILDEVYPGPLSTNYLDGKYYGLPLTTNTQIYIYDVHAFEAAGVTPPQTFADFETVSRRMTQRDGGVVTRYGYDMGGPWAWYLLSWIWSNGGDVTDPEITTASGYLDGGATVEALTMISEWALEGLLAPNIFGEGFDQWGSFVNGKVAARQDGPWFARWLEEENPNFKAGYAVMPVGRGGVSCSVVGGENIALTSGSKSKDEAWKFICFMLSEEAQGIMAANGQVPVIRSAVDIPEFQASDYYPVYLEQLLTAKARTPHPRYSEIEQIMQDAFWNTVTGETNARNALSEAVRLINPVLE
ncbi:MAG: extracellular solute-binding protein [Limnochordia bacterium]|nr:extracellular solute-binding protein [Limnochordia bacterium]